MISGELLEIRKYHRIKVISSDAHAHIRFNDGHNGTEITNMTMRESYLHHRCVSISISLRFFSWPTNKFAGPVTNNNARMLNVMFFSEGYLTLLKL